MSCLWSRGLFGNLQVRDTKSVVLEKKVKSQGYSDEV